MAIQIDFATLPILKCLLLSVTKLILIDDLAASAFVAYPSDDIDTVYEQYVSSLSDLLDIHAPMKMWHLTKPSPAWITNEFRIA